MRKTFITMIVLLVVLIISSGLILNKCFETFESETEEIEKHLGQKYILDSDTLTIIDYSILDDTYTLSNGKKIKTILVK